MSRYPTEVRQAAVKCISCNAPVVQTIDGTYVCVECGESPVQTSTVGSGDLSVNSGEFASGQEAFEDMTD